MEKQPKKTRKSATATIAQLLTAAEELRLVREAGTPVTSPPPPQFEDWERALLTVQLTLVRMAGKRSKTARRGGVTLAAKKRERKQLEIAWPQVSEPFFGEDHDVNEP